MYEYECKEANKKLYLTGHVTSEEAQALANEIKRMAVTTAVNIDEISSAFRKLLSACEPKETSLAFEDAYRMSKLAYAKVKRRNRNLERVRLRKAKFKI